MKKNLLIVGGFTWNPVSVFCDFSFLDYKTDIFRCVLYPMTKIVLSKKDIILVCKTECLQVCNMIAKDTDNKYCDLFQKILVLFDKLEDINQLIVFNDVISYNNIIIKMCENNLLNGCSFNDIRKDFLKSTLHRDLFYKTYFEKYFIINEL